MQAQAIEKSRKKILSIVKKLGPIELKSLENYAEFLSQKNSDLKLLEVLRNAKPEDEELDPSEMKGVEISKEEIKKGQFREFKDYMKERCLL
jgi:hypothetical protein